MTALVTGASGFIGRAVTRRLLEAGERVRVLVRSRERFSGLGIEGVEVFEGDITDAEAVDRAVRGIECVYAVAGTFREPNLSDARYREVNVEGVRNIMEAARRHGARRVVHCSTVGIHGDVKGSPLDENAPVVPEGIYEITKAEGEAVALEYGRRGDLEVTVVRPAPVYGPGDLRLLKMFKMARKNPIVMIGPGTARYHMIYIDDLAEIFLRAGRREGLNGEALLAAGPEAPSLEELFLLLARLLGNEDPRLLRLPAWPMLVLADLCEYGFRPLGLNPPIYRRRVQFFLANRHYRIDKLRHRLDFEPAVGVEEGLSRTAAWYRDNGHL